MLQFIIGKECDAHTISKVTKLEVVFSSLSRPRHCVYKLHSQQHAPIKFIGI